MVENLDSDSISDHGLDFVKLISKLKYKETQSLNITSKVHSVFLMTTNPTL